MEENVLTQSEHTADSSPSFSAQLGCLYTKAELLTQISEDYQADCHCHILGLSTEGTFLYFFLK